MTTNPAKVVTKIEFGVLGEPVGQPRPRAFARKFGKKWQARVYTPGTAEAWKSAIAAAAKEHLPLIPWDGPLRLSVTFTMPRPKKHSRGGDVDRGLRDDAPDHHVGTPDLDNMLKAVKDALGQIGLWDDDCQVCEYGTVEKKYTLGWKTEFEKSAQGYNGVPSHRVRPGAIIKIERI